MIYDELKNIGAYKGISPWFDVAASFLMETDLKALPLGRTEILDSHVYINVMEADTKEAAETDFEIHKKYWDIQINIEGTEALQIGLGPEKVLEEFQEDIDFGRVSCQEYIECRLEHGRFVVCMDGEPHKPTLTLDGCHHVKKCVVKVEKERTGVQKAAQK